MILIVDGTYLAYRALHSYSFEFGGHDTSILYGVFNTLNSAIRKYRPSSILVAWDGGIPPIRRILLPSYKTGRSELSEADREKLNTQIIELQEQLPCFGVLSLKLPDVEADDIIYQAASRSQEDVIVLSADRDLLQTLRIGDHVRVYDPQQDKLTDRVAFEEEYGISPDQFIDYRILVGDQSDHIAGVQGIGDKRAVGILSEYKTLENALLAAQGASWQASKSAQTYLCKADTLYMEKVRNVIDLSCDCNGVGRALYRAVQEWRPYQHDKARYWAHLKGFKSFVMELKGWYGKLTCPNLRVSRKNISIGGLT